MSDAAGSCISRPYRKFRSVLKPSISRMRFSSLSSSNEYDLETGQLLARAGMAPKHTLLGPDIVRRQHSAWYEDDNQSIKRFQHPSHLRATQQRADPCGITFLEQ